MTADELAELNHILDVHDQVLKVEPQTDASYKYIVCNLVPVKIVTDAIAYASGYGVTVAAPEMTEEEHGLLNAELEPCGLAMRSVDAASGVYQCCNMVATSSVSDIIAFGAAHGVTIAP